MQLLVTKTHEQTADARRTQTRTTRGVKQQRWTRASCRKLTTHNTRATVSCLLHDGSRTTTPWVPPKTARPWKQPLWCATPAVADKKLQHLPTHQPSLPPHKTRGTMTGSSKTRKGERRPAQNCSQCRAQGALLCAEKGATATSMQACCRVQQVSALQSKHTHGHGCRGHVPGTVLCDCNTERCTRTHHHSLALHRIAPRHTPRALSLPTMCVYECHAKWSWPGYSSSRKTAPHHKRAALYKLCDMHLSSDVAGWRLQQKDPHTEAEQARHAATAPVGERAPEECHAAAHSHNAQLQDNTIPHCSRQAHKICCCRLPHPGKTGREKIVRAGVAVRPALQLVV